MASARWASRSPCSSAPWSPLASDGKPSSSGRERSSSFGPLPIACSRETRHKGLVRRRSPEAFQSGSIVDTAGQTIGTHEGHQHFTIGQRKGVGVALGYPIYVVDIDPASNTVMVGERAALLRHKLIARQVNVLSDRVQPGLPLSCHAKIRYNHMPQQATMTWDGADMLNVTFLESQSAITPGQAVVCYADDFVLAGGWIESAGAYIGLQDAQDPNRTILLDPVMLRLLGERGARCVGIDPIPAMVHAAGERRSGALVRGMAESLPFAAESFDLVVSYVTLVDIAGFREAIAGMARVLRPGGRLVAANLGFVTAGFGWEKAPDGTRHYQKIDRYAEEWSRVYDWDPVAILPHESHVAAPAGTRIRIENWHRPLANYMQAYLSAGLVLRAFEEPVPEDQSLREQYYFEDWFRVPLFNVMRWEKLA